MPGASIALRVPFWSMSDVGNGGRMRREASAERIEIRQSSGVELGIDSPSELGFAGTIMSERQQSDDRAARLLSLSPASNASKAR